jgi:hypothetical protein
MVQRFDLFFESNLFFFYDHQLWWWWEILSLRLWWEEQHPEPQLMIMDGWMNEWMEGRKKES